MAFPVQPILDTCVRANEGPPPSASWVSSVDSDHGGMQIISNKMAPNTTGQCSAMWALPFNALMEVYADIDTFPVTGQSLEMWLNVQNGDTATPSGYLLRFWHHSGSGVGALELDRHDAGSNTRLFDEGATLSLGDQLGLWNDDGVLRVYVNGVEKTNFAEADTTHRKAGGLGVGTLNDSSQLTRLSLVGGGAPSADALSPHTQGGSW